MTDRKPFTREAGGWESRVRGVAVHTLLEKLSELRASCTWDGVRAALSAEKPQLVAQILASGFDRVAANRMAEDAIDVAVTVSHDPTGQWVLDPHAEAQSEVRWTGVLNGEICTVQADRVFRAGNAPLQPGTDSWWIVDYKSAAVKNGDPDATLASLRSVFLPQVEAYGRMFRQIHDENIKLYAGIYYPKWQKLDFWELLPAF